MQFDTLLLQAPGGNSGLINMVFLGGMLVVLYFFIIRPQAKKQREQNTFVTDMKEGDRVVTTSGIYGRISRIEKEAITLDIGAGTKTTIRVLKSSISKELTESALSSEVES
ncbi:MAG: preprotein translocase subunit YajC [Bacteroidota bacterium]